MFDQWFGRIPHRIASRRNGKCLALPGVVDVSHTSLGGIVFGVAIGIAMIGGGGYMWYEQDQRINSYETTEGTVLSSQVYDDPNGADYIDISYEYTANGETYRSSNVEPGNGDDSMSRSRAEEFVENHSQGEPITVYYDPANPANAYLIEEQTIIFTAMAGFGALVTIVTLRMLVNRLSDDSTQ